MANLIPDKYQVEVDISIGSIVMLACAAIAVITFQQLMKGK